MKKQKRKRNGIWLNRTGHKDLSDYYKIGARALMPLLVIRDLRSTYITILIGETKLSKCCGSH